MEIRYPDYYKGFSCLAGACPDSCCHEWEVDVDPAAADYYRHLPGEIGDRIRAVLRDGEDGWASMALTEDRRCPMWRADGLCHIQAELGHDDLCDTCRNFPRLTHDYGDFMELGLEMSCPEAARIILSNPHAKWITEEVPGGEPPEYDEQYMKVLQISRDKAVELALDETVPVGDAIASVLVYAHIVYYATDMSELREFEREYHLEKFRSKKMDVFLEEFWDPYWNLEILTDRWKGILERGPVDVPWKPEHRALMRYFIDRYWYHSAYDDDFTTRAIFMALSCLVIRSMGDHTVEMAQLYSKEIENDADNVEALYEFIRNSSPAYLTKLLIMLLK